MAIGWGIIGLGLYVDRIMIPAFSKAANAKLVAACSRDLDKAKTFASKYNIAEAYDSYDKMLRDPKIDAVYIATPNYLHAEHTIKAAEAGKHVLCEKPMALKVADAERMVEACEKQKVRLAIEFPGRFHPAHAEARRLIKEGITGQITVVKSQCCMFVPGDTNGLAGTDNWRIDPGKAGAGALMGPGLHPIDLLRFLLNSEVEEVIALLEPQGIDNMEYVIMKFANDTRGMAISGLRVPRSDNEVVLYGINAKVTCKGTLGPAPEGELLIEGDFGHNQTAYSHQGLELGNCTHLIEHFNECITENHETESSGRNGLQMVKIANAIIESSLSQKPVKVT